MITVRDAAGLPPFHGGVFVPTMGALHAGHVALIERAERIAGRERPRLPVIVSVFVNPTQFNEKQDFDRYPRDIERDTDLCARAGADCVFVPSVEAIYPPDGSVKPPQLPAVARQPGLEDAFRPGHFAGVCQVVKRLFELVRPAAAVFGEKDWQQLAVIRAMVEEQKMPVRIEAHETIREADGLAMSSRNALLSPSERRRATALFKALREASRHEAPAAAEKAMRPVLLINRVVPEYAVVRDAATLGPVATGRPARALIAARLGSVRLIDNAPWPGSAVAGIGRGLSLER